MPRVTKKDMADKVIEENKKMKKNTTKKNTSSSPQKNVNTSKEVKKEKSTKKVEEKNIKARTSNLTKSIKPSDKSKKNKTTTSVKNSKKVTTRKSTVIPYKSILSRTRELKINDNDVDIDVNSNLVEQSTVLEYYDLPYRYNQTTVKILAQTPSVLFVYWDINDDDRARFIKEYGDNFFETTTPILIVHNKTKDYYFEVEINDFANSWYLRMQEPDCEYEIELLRRSNQDTSKYIYISSSNNLISPNNHVLFEKTDFEHIAFRNVKTGQITYKDFGSLRLLTNIGNIYNQKHKVLNFYKDMYSDEVLESNKMFSNPSSSNPSSRSKLF